MNLQKDLSRREFLKMAAITGGSALAATQLGGLAAACKKSSWDESDLKLAAKKEDAAKIVLPGTLAAIETKDFSHLRDTVEGLSWNQLEQHIGLYQNYVKGINATHAKLQEMHRTGDFSDMGPTMRKQSYTLNGAILHDLYFSNLGGTDKNPLPVMAEFIQRDFGDYSTYQNHLKAVGKAMRGWAMTGFNMLDGKIHNYGLDLHDHGSPMGVYPLVVMDVYEHAYMIDFGTNRGDYLDVFFRNIDWGLVESRVQAAAMIYNDQASQIA